MAAAYRGYRESQTQRSALRVPGRPFLWIEGHGLICPWPPARVLSVEQAGELRQVLAVLQARAGEDMPRFAWVTVGGDVTPMPTPEPAWIARRTHDGHTVAVGPPARQRGGRRISPAASRVFQQWARGEIVAGQVLQP
jgi:hypothetical protein